VKLYNVVIFQGFDFLRDHQILLLAKFNFLQSNRVLKVLGKNMSVSVMKSDRVSDKGGRRTGIDRREFSFTAYGPERRNGDDRRGYVDRRQKRRLV